MNDSPIEREAIKQAKNYILNSIPPLRDTLADTIIANDSLVESSKDLLNSLTNLFEKGIMSKELNHFRDLIYKNIILLEQLAQDSKEYLEHLDKMLHWAK